MIPDLRVVNSSPLLGVELTKKKKKVLDQKLAITVVLKCLQDSQNRVKALLMIRHYVNNRFHLDGFVLTWPSNVPESGLFWQVNHSDCKRFEA